MRKGFRVNYTLRACGNYVQGSQYIKAYSVSEAVTSILSHVCRKLHLREDDCFVRKVEVIYE